MMLHELLDLDNWHEGEFVFNEINVVPEAKAELALLEAVVEAAVGETQRRDHRMYYECECNLCKAVDAYEQGRLREVKDEGS